jgi:hypothetical protein
MIIIMILYNVLCSIGVVSGKSIFGPPLDEYWRKKRLEEEAAASAEAATATAKENDSSIST